MNEWNEPLRTFRSRLPDSALSVVGLPLFTEGMVSSGRRIELQAADIALGGSLVCWCSSARRKKRGR